MTPTQLQQLARETAEAIDSNVLIYDNGGSFEFVNERILAALEQVSREERKEAQALLNRIEPLTRKAVNALSIALQNPHNDNAVCKYERQSEDAMNELRAVIASARENPVHEMTRPESCYSADLVARLEAKTKEAQTLATACNDLISCLEAWGPAPADAFVIKSTRAALAAWKEKQP